MCISYYMKEKGGVLQKLSDCFTEDGQYVDRAERRGLFSSLSKNHTVYSERQIIGGIK